MKRIFAALVVTLASAQAFSQNANTAGINKQEDLTAARQFLASIVDANTYVEQAAVVRKKIEQSCKEQSDVKFDEFSSSLVNVFYTCSPNTHIKILGIEEKGDGRKKQVVFMGIRLGLSDFDWVKDVLTKKFGKKFNVEDFKKTLPADKSFDKFRGTTRYSWSLGRDKRVLHGFDRYVSLEKDVLRQTVTIELAEDEVSGD